MVTERYEEGMRIISVETEEEFLEAMDQMTNYRVAIEARKQSWRPWRSIRQR